MIVERWFCDYNALCIIIFIGIMIFVHWTSGYPISRLCHMSKYVECVRSHGLEDFHCSQGIELAQGISLGHAHPDIAIFQVVLVGLDLKVRCIRKTVTRVSLGP